MTNREARAWSAVGVIGLAALGVGLMVQAFRLPRWQLAIVFALLGAACFVTLAVALAWRKRRYPDGIMTDEREESIRLRAGQAGTIGMMLAVCLSCLVPSLLARLRHQRRICLDRVWLMAPFFFGLLAWSAAYFVASWILRRRDGSHGSQ